MSCTHAHTHTHTHAHTHTQKLVQARFSRCSQMPVVLHAECHLVCLRAKITDRNAGTVTCVCACVCVCVCVCRLRHMGRLRRMIVQHDNSGANPAWHLFKVVVTSDRDKAPVTFVCNDWIRSAVRACVCVCVCVCVCACVCVYVCVCPHIPRALMV